MANEEHLETLRKGVQAWNKWRKEHAEIQPDLSEVNLAWVTDLGGVDLHEADLSKADLIGANLSRANLRKANLGWADLSGAHLLYADLRDADLSASSLSGTLLWGANLGGARLWRPILRGADLSGADLTNAITDLTVFADNDLSATVGLENVKHDGPSTVGIDTIYRSKGNIPEVFLRGCGVPEDMIAYARSIRGKAFEFYSCFISHSAKDKRFCERLYADLQVKGVRV